jgi:hypothetical protein
MALRPNVARLRDQLLKAQVIDELQMRSAIAHLEQWGGRLPAVLVEMGFCDEEELTTRLGEVLRLPTMHLGMVHHDKAAISKVSPDFCEEHGVFPVSLQGHTAVVAMADPTEVDTIDTLAAKLGARVQVVLASETEIRNAINRHYRGLAPTAQLNRARKAFTAGIPPAASSAPRAALPPSRAGDAEFELDTTAPPMPGAAETAGASSAWLSRPPSANTMLDEFFDEGGAPKTDGFSPEELKRLEAARLNQEKAAAIMRALQSLLTEKGYLG